MLWHEVVPPLGQLGNGVGGGDGERSQVPVPYTNQSQSIALIDSTSNLLTHTMHGWVNSVMEVTAKPRNQQSLSEHDLPVVTGDTKRDKSFIAKLCTLSLSEPQRANLQLELLTQTGKTNRAHSTQVCPRKAE